MGFLSKLLGTVSGNNGGFKISEQLIFDKVIGFRGIVPGVGTSTIVQNTAIALSEKTNYSICVLDVNFLYPTQYPMLITTPDKKRVDFLDFTGDLSVVTLETSIKNVNLVSLSSRTVIDMMSSRDSEQTVNKLIGSLKSYFDIILVDLGHELTNINIHTAIKCNKVIGIADQSLKCIYHLQKSLNTMATLAVPLAKADKIILNKVLPDVNTNTGKVVEESGLTVIGEIPFSLELAKSGVSGKRIYAESTSNKDVYAFSSVIDTLLDDLLERTPLNDKYINETEAVELSDGKKQKKKKITPAPVVPVVAESSDIADFVLEDPVIEEELHVPTKPVVKQVEEPKPKGNLVIVEDDDEADINEEVDV